VACLPQAWAAGSVFMLLQACLGLTIDAERAQVEVRDPVLPTGIDRLSVGDLRIGDGSIDLTFERQGARVAVHSNSRGPSLRVRYGC
jgi:glycogen debranching enzyme